MMAAATFLGALDVHSDSKPPFVSLTSRKRPRPIKNYALIQCTKSETPPAPPSNSNSILDSDRKKPSLAEQLRPLSTTILSDKPPGPIPILNNKPNSVWVNPTKSRPSVLNLQRHKRSPYALNPLIQDLKLFARKLNACAPVASDFLALLHELPHPPTRDNALLVLNSLKPWPKSLLFFNWVKTQNLFPMETIFYNVAMKVLGSGRQFLLIEDLAHEMIRDDIELDNITYSTIITCAKRCNLFDKALEWFERMYKTGLMPDEVTYSTVLDVYVKLGKVEEVMSLYDRGRANGWKPDPIAFAVLAKMFGEAGDYDGIRFVMREMQTVEVRPNLVVYNTLLEALGKAGKPGLARSLFEEMVTSDITPNAKTLTALVKIYGKARWGRDALDLWERMKSSGWHMDLRLYNTLLNMCADLGLEEEAENLFKDMKGSKFSRPDCWSYTAMLNVYASGRKVDNAIKLFEEMSHMGIEINVMGCTCLIQCLGKAKRIDDLVRVFEVSIKRGVKPDDRLCGCLLSVVSYCENDDLDKVLSCLQQSSPGLASFINLLEDEKNGIDMIKEEFKSILNNTTVESRRPFCNCLIDICRKRSLDQRAHELLYLGIKYGLYPGLHTKTPEEWRLNVRSLSVGAAQTAFEEWLVTLYRMIKLKEALPELLSASAGAGTHKYSHGLANAFDLHVKKLSAPFRQREDKTGIFVATRDDLVSWAQSKDLSLAVTAQMNPLALRGNISISG